MLVRPDQKNGAISSTTLSASCATTSAERASTPAAVVAVPARGSAFSGLLQPRTVALSAGTASENETSDHGQHQVKVIDP